jgi:hypothetical protein
MAKRGKWTLLVVAAAAAALSAPARADGRVEFELVE